MSIEPHFEPYRIGDASIQDNTSSKGKNGATGPGHQLKTVSNYKEPWLSRICQLIVFPFLVSITKI